jgi:hypothetical protein
MYVLNIEHGNTAVHLPRKRIFTFTNYKKHSHNTPMEPEGERRCSSFSFTTAALDGGEWSEPRPGRTSLPGKRPPVPTGKEAGWALERVWTQEVREKSLDPTGDRTWSALSFSPQLDTILTKLPRFLTNYISCISGCFFLSRSISYLHYYEDKGNVRFQVLTAASMKFRVFWDILPSSQIDVDRRFTGACCLHHQDDKWAYREKVAGYIGVKWNGLTIGEWVTISEEVCQWQIGIRERET